MVAGLQPAGKQAEESEGVLLSEHKVFPANQNPAQSHDR